MPDNNSNQDREPIQNQEYVRLNNANSNDHSIYDKLNDPRFDPEAAKIAEEARIGTLDDHVDITDPDYNEAETKAIENELNAGRYRT